MSARLSKLEWDLLIARARDVPIEDELARRGIQLKREGDELVGPCPICCDGTDRFAANTRKDVFNCRICKAKGDVVHFVQHIEGVGRREAAEMLTDRDRPRSAAAPAPPTKPQRSDAERSQHAVGFWYRAHPAAGTKVVTYLRSRGITIPPPLTLRFEPSVWHPESDDYWPAMIGIVVRGTDNTPIAIHRTFLARNGMGKAPIKPDKKMLGPVSGGCVRLAAAVDGHVRPGEGIESCLSVQQATGLPTWAALSAGGIRRLQLPDDIRRVTILADKDDDGEGEAAAIDAGRRWQSEGHTVKIARPPPGEDFNDMLIRLIRKKSA